MGVGGDSRGRWRRIAGGDDSDKGSVGGDSSDDEDSQGGTVDLIKSLLN